MSAMTPLRLAVAGSAVSCLLAACGGGTPAEALRPKDQTYAATMGEGSGTCHEIESTGEPLVVDWKPEQRGDLEVLMRDGVAVVAYSCKGLKLLKDCKVDGEYGFLGMTKKEQLVRLENQDEVKANLPLAGAGLAANLGAEMDRGATLDIALVLIGKKKTTWPKVSSADLKGECEGATHFVKGATVGAFVMETGSKAQARTAAQLFGAGASGGSASSKNVRNQDGELADCAKAAPDSKTPPAQCQAVVRLELKAIASAPQGPEVAPAAEPKAEAEVAVVERSCPKGLVWADGKCAETKNAASFQCDPQDGGACVEQCAKGHAGSCGAAGTLYGFGGGGLSKDDAKARELLGKSCDGGDAKGCVNLGVLVAQGRGGGKDAALAAQSFQQGCNDGEAMGCRLAAVAHREGAGVTKDDARAAALFQKGCDGGDHESCGTLGKMTLDGAGVSKDVAKAAELLKRACDGNQAASCNELGLLHEIGRDVSKNAILAKMRYQRACFAGDAQGCANQGRLELGPGGNADAAKRAFELGCTRRSTVACAALKVLYGDARPFVAPPAEVAALAKSCGAGVTRDCATSGLYHTASGNKALGAPSIERACIGGDPLACAIKKK